MRWETKPLSEIVEPPISGEWGTGEGDIKVIRTTNFTNSGALDLTNVVEREIDTRKVGKKRLLAGDVIIEKSGGSPNQPVGRVVYFDVSSGTYLCNNFTSVLRPRSRVASRYLFWYLFSLHQSGRTLRYQNKTTGILNLKLERYLKETNIPLPPLDIQRQISDTLDKADALRRKDHQLSQKYDELIQSLYFTLFDNPENEYVPLSDLCADPNDIRCGPFGTQLLSSEFVQSGVYLWGIRHVNKEFRTLTHEYLDEQKAASLSVYSIKPGDIVVTRKGTIGNAALYPEHLAPGVMHSDLLRIRVDGAKIDPTFLLYQFKLSARLRAQISRISNGAIMAGINVGKLKPLLVEMPDPVVQKAFTSQVKRILASQDALRRSQEQSTLLFNALLNRYFA